MEKENKGYCIVDYSIAKKYNLTIYELNIYSAIKSYTDAGSCYYGSLKQLADCFNISVKTVTRSLSHLLEIGFIKKEDVKGNGCVHFVKYTSTQDTIAPQTIVNDDTRTSDSPSTIVPQTNNIKDYNKDYNNNIRQIANNKSCLRNSLIPSFSDVEEYCKTHPDCINPNQFLKWATGKEWKDKNGKPWIDWKKVYSGIPKDVFENES